MNDVASRAVETDGPITLSTVVPGLPPIAGPAKFEAEALFQAAVRAQPGCTVVIGKLSGLNTLALCAGADAGGPRPVYVVKPGGEADDTTSGDPGAVNPAFFAKAASTELARHLRWFRAPSIEAARGWSEPISLLVFAADRAAWVDEDLTAWRDKLTAATTIVFDRATITGATQALERFVNNHELVPDGNIKRLAMFRPGTGPAANFKVRWSDIGHGVYYGKGGSYLYQPIPKCACTTIKTLLLEYEGLPIDEDEWRRHTKHFNKFPGTSHLPDPEQRDIFEGRTSTFKFVIVRNPWERLASVYADKVVKRVAWVMRNLEASAQRLGVALSDPVTFEEFVDLVSRQNVKEMDPHWRPQYAEGRFATIRYDFVGRMENMPGDLISALERIGAPQSIVERANQRHNATGSDVAMWDSVSPAVRDRFLAAYGIDFDTLGYSRELPVQQQRSAAG